MSKYNYLAGIVVTERAQHVGIWETTSWEEQYDHWRKNMIPYGYLEVTRDDTIYFYPYIITRLHGLLVFLNAYFDAWGSYKVGYMVMLKRSKHN